MSGETVISIKATSGGDAFETPMLKMNRISAGEGPGGISFIERMDSDVDGLHSFIGQGSDRGWMLLRTIIDRLEQLAGDAVEKIAADAEHLDEDARRRAMAWVDDQRRQMAAVS